MSIGSEVGSEPQFDTAKPGLFLVVNRQEHSFKRAIPLRKVKKGVQGEMDVVMVEGQLRKVCEFEEGRIEGDAAQRERSQRWVTTQTDR